jgi:hypothetical protein
MSSLFFQFLLDLGEIAGVKNEEQKLVLVEHFPLKMDGHLGSGRFWVKF